MSGLHKDFHGYHSFILKYVEKKYGRQFMFDGLRRIGKNVYSDVAEKLKKQGLEYFADYWKEIFELENGKFQIELEDDKLTLRVEQCPAVAHIHNRNWDISPVFCEHTRIINEEICKAAGYLCSIEYDQEKGRCVQQFWKARK